MQSIAATIKPAVYDVVQFLKEHFQNDIRCIARNTAHNDIEAEQIIHLVLVGIVNNSNQQNGRFDHFDEYHFYPSSLVSITSSSHSFCFMFRVKC